MEGTVYECQCGHVLTESEIDFKAKRAVCSRCGSVVSLTRKQINGTSAVASNVEAAVSAFLERDYARAKDVATSVLSVSDDNIPALFISAHYNAFHAPIRKELMLRTFFDKELKEIDATEEEMAMLMKMLLHDALRVAEYEEQILSAVVANCSPEDVQAFVDEFSPRLIVQRTSIDWFTPEMCEAYCKVSQITNVPKTWFALYKQVSENPDSPEVRNEFFLAKKTERFFNSFILGVEKIYENIADAQQKAKFTTAFAARKDKFKQKM